MINLLLVFLISINFFAISTPSVPKYRIIGERYAKLDEFPYLVEVRKADTFRYHISCGGSIINESFILTAAHCTFYTDKLDENVKHKYKPSDLVIVAGQIKAEVTISSVVRKIKKIVRHPRYDGIILSNDVAIFELEEKLPMTDFIKPIPLRKERVHNNVNCSVAGWGSEGYNWQTRTGVGFPDTCKKATVRTLDPVTCWKKNLKALDDASICVEGIIGNDGKRENLCTGDSGGPLVCNGLNTGICSYGIDGCIKGIIFVEIAYYLPWIQYQRDEAGISPRKRNIAYGSSSKPFCRNNYFYFLLIVCYCNYILTY